MSAAVLRRAAKSMRERAEAATPERWIAVVGQGPKRRLQQVALVGKAGMRGQGETGCLAVLAGLPATRRAADAEHIASWHPAVALAVADWLDGIAETHESDPSDYCGEVCTDGSWWCANVTHALAVARTYLGES